jgi:hypothetical protein
LIGANICWSFKSSRAAARYVVVLATPSPLTPNPPTWGLHRFEWRDGKLFRRSMSEENKEWEIVQTMDSVTPGNAHFSEKSQRAKPMNKDGVVSSQMPGNDASLAHANSSMTCYTCHTSWTPKCFGCHRQMTANARKPMLHNEGLLTRNYTSYNFQVLRDDIYMLGVDGTVTGHRIAPARSACAVLVSSQNANRDWLYYTQQTISAPGFSGQAFSTFVPHTVRAKETKQCSDCHVSAQNDNNAWMAQLLLQGTNFMNFMGRYVYVATGNKGFEAIAVAEHDEPEAIYGATCNVSPIRTTTISLSKFIASSAPPQSIPVAFSTFKPAESTSRPPNSSLLLALAALPLPFRRVLIATAPWTSPATSLLSSAAAGHARSTARKCAGSTFIRVRARLMA